MSSSNKQSVVDDIVSAFETTQNQPWSMFNDKLNNVSNNHSKNKDMAKSDNSINLSSDDLPVFGLVPRLDKVMLVSCYECAMIVKRDCIHSHFYRRHNGSNVVNHSEADKFSLVNFLCTVNTNKNKRPKMNVRKPSEKKNNECEKVNTNVKRIKTEFNQAEYDRLKTNGTKIKEENTTEYANKNDVDMVTTSFKPNTTSSGVFQWDVKSCIKYEGHHTGHKVDEEMIEQEIKKINKLSTVSLGIKEELQSNKHLDIQKNEHTINYVTGPSQLLQAVDPVEKIKHKINIGVSESMIDSEEKYLKKYYYAKNQFQTYLPYKIRKINDQTKLTINNESKDIITNKNVDDNSTSYNQWVNTSAVDIKYDSKVPCSGLQNNGEKRKLFLGKEYLYVKIDMPSDSATDYYQSTESPKIKEEFQILPNNMFPDVKLKEEYEEYNNKYNVEFNQSPLTECLSGNNHSKLTKCLSDNNHSEVINNTDSGNVVDNNNHSSIVPYCGTVREETTFTKSNENILMNNENSENTVPKNQWSTALLDINEESKTALITDYINEKSKPSLNTVLINDDSLTKYYQMHTNESCSPLSPNLKYEDDKHLNPKLDLLGENSLSNDLNLQIEENLNNQLELHVEDDLDVALNLQIEVDLKNKPHLKNNDDVLVIEDSLKYLQGFLTGGRGHLNDQLKMWDEEDSQNEEDSQDEKDLQDEESLIEEVNLSDDDYYLSDDVKSEDGVNIEEKKNFINYALNIPSLINSQERKKKLDSISNLSDEGSNIKVENLSDKEDMSDEKDLNDGKNVSGNYLETTDDLKCNNQVPYRLTNNEEEIKVVPMKKCSVNINNESSNAASTDYDQSLAETLSDDEESKAKSIKYDASVIIDNNGVVNNFENEYYQSSPELYDNKAQTSFTPSYKYSDIISNESSDSQSSVESLDISDKIDHSSSDTSPDRTSEESLYDSDSNTSSSDQSTILQDITKNPKYAQTNFLKDHGQFTGRISKLIDSFDFVDGKNNCTQTNVPVECTNCYTTTEDFIASTQIDKHIDSIPDNSNGQMDGYDVSNFTPISSSAQIINNTIIPVDVEECELKNSNDCSCYVSNRFHNLSHIHPHTCNPASQIDNLTHSPINENNSKIYSADIYAYKPIEYILPFIKKNNEVCKNHMKMVGKKCVKERKCKIMPYNRTAKNFKTNLKRQAADGKENLSHLVTNGFKKCKMVFIDRDFSCSDESDNNVDD